MNTRNLEYLEQGLKYLGFDSSLNEALAKQVSEGKSEFQLQQQKSFGNDLMTAVLSFRKSDQVDMYFFNKYEATLSRRDEQKTQTFYIQKNNGITLKEAYNLLCGRSVNKDLLNKEGVKYNAWMQLDFSQKDKYDNYQVKQYHANYGYDLPAALEKHPIKELASAEEKEKLIRSLEKGNIQSVSFVKDSSEEKMFIEANPQYKTLNVYDAHMKMVKQESKTQDIKEGPAQTGELQKTSKSTKTKKQQEGTTSLLPKKRSASKKGLHM